MKSFLLFVGEQYYPRGGWDDFHGDFDSIKEAVEFVAANPTFRSMPDDDWGSDIQWAHVVDSTTMKVVRRFRDEFNTTTKRFERMWSPQ